MTPQHFGNRLLIVDDDEPFRLRLARAFRKRGYSVDPAANPTQVNDLLQQGAPPDYAVIDLRMPEGSGLSLIPAILQAAPACRIVLLTGYGSIATAVEAVRLGAVDYLTKPATADAIEQALTNMNSAVSENSMTTRPPTLEQVEWEHLQRILTDCNQNISQTARVLGIERRTLQRKLQKYAPQP